MKKIVVFVVLVFALFTIVKAEEVLTYDKYMNKIKDNLPELEKYNLEVKKAKNEIYGSEGVDDYIINSNLNYIKEKGYQTYSDLRGVNFSTKISKKFKNYGTSVYSSFNYSRSEIEGEEKIVTSIQNDMPIYESLAYSRDRYNPELEIGFMQPLLYNAQGVLDKFPVKNAKMNYEIEKIKRDISRENTLNYYKKLYFDWIAQNRLIEMMEESLNNVKKIQNIVEDKYESGLVDGDELEKAKSRMINYKKQVLNSKMMLDIIKEELSVIIDIEGYEPDYRIFKKYLEEACSVCDEKNRIVPFESTKNYKIIKKSLERLGLVKKISENKTLPELNLNGRIALKAQENEFVDSISGMNDLDYQFGISLNLPVKNQRAKSEYIDSKISIERLNYELKESRNNYLKSLKRILQQLESKSRLMDYIDENLSVLNKEYVTEEKKYEQARFELQFLLDTENRITDEKRNMISIKNELIGLYLDYINLTE